MNKTVKRVLVGTGIISGAIATACYIVSRELYKKTIVRDEEKRNKENEILDNMSKIQKSMNAFNKGQKWFDDNLTEEVYTESYDGLNLHGFYFEAPTPSDITVIRCHGYGSSARTSLLANNMFRDEYNANILALNLRGHGKSDGEYVGFGWHDRLDILKWVDFIIEKNGSDHKIVLYGGSMGGATVMMASGEDLPPNVRLVIEDCGYSSVNKIFKYQIKNAYHLPENPFLPIADIITRLQAGYGFEEASSVEQLKKAKVPVLFIHGGEDVFVPTYMVYEVYEACPTDKDLLIVEEAGHNESFIVDPKGYSEFIKPFMEKYVCHI